MSSASATEPKAIADTEPGAVAGTEPGAVAVFDLDGTVTRHDTYVAFLRLLMLRRRRFARLPGLMVQAARFKLGRIGNDALKAAFLDGMGGGVTREALDGWMPGFVAGQRHQVKHKALWRIGWHRERGDRLVLASASLDAYAVPFGLALGFDTVVATRVLWRDGRLDGRLAGPNLRGAAKVAALAEQGIRPDYAYTDHHSDLPLLQAARFPVAVDPTPKLLALAGSAIPVERWS